MQLQPHHVGIVVSDLERSMAFYEALGFEIASDIPRKTGPMAIRFMRCGTLKAAGIVSADVEARDVPAGFRVAFFKDPDGMEIELTQPL